MDNRREMSVLGVDAVKKQHRSLVDAIWAQLAMFVIPRPCPEG